MLVCKHVCFLALAFKVWNQRMEGHRDMEEGDSLSKLWVKDDIHASSVNPPHACNLSLCISLSYLLPFVDFSLPTSISLCIREVTAMSCYICPDVSRSRKDPCLCCVTKATGKCYIPDSCSLIVHLGQSPAHHQKPSLDKHLLFWSILTSLFWYC